VNSCCATTYTTTKNHYNESITGHKKLKKLYNVKIGNLKRKNRDHKKVHRQDEDAGSLQILLHLRSIFDCYYLKTVNSVKIHRKWYNSKCYAGHAVEIRILNVIEFSSY